MALKLQNAEMYRRQVLTKLLALLALLFATVPLLIFAYSSTFSRMHMDDYGYLGKALEVGAWESMLFWRGLWNGDYTSFLVHGMLAPLGVKVPAVFPMVIMALGLAGLAWLTNMLLSLLTPDRQQYLAVSALAALTLAATFHGFLDRGTIFWLSATVEYTLPAVNLLLLVTLAWSICGRLNSRSSLAIGALAAGVIAFINAGFSELFMVFQILFVLLLLLGLLKFLHGTRQRAAATLCFAGLLGSLASLPLQFFSPGITYRAAAPSHGGIVLTPARDPLQLFTRTLEESLQIAGHQPAFAGFMLAFAAGMLAALALSKPATEKPGAKTFMLQPGALALVLLSQLAYLPLLWNHASDSAQILGRFSPAYFLVIVLNAGFLLLFSFQFIQRRRISAWLAQPNASLIYASALLLAVLLLFALSQFRSIHWRAASYMFASALSLIVFLARQLISGSRTSGADSLIRVAVACTVIAALTFAGLLAVQLWGTGLTYGRVFTPTTYLLMISALMWGLCLGQSLKRETLRSRSNPWWIRGHIAIGLLVALIVGGGIISVTARQIEGRAAFAAIWDAQHQEILRLRDAEDPAVYTLVVAQRFTTDPITDEWHIKSGAMNWTMKMYYGLDYEVVPFGQLAVQPPDVK